MFCIIKTLKKCYTVIYFFFLMLMRLFHCYRDQTLFPFLPNPFTPTTPKNPTPTPQFHTGIAG